MMLTAYTILVKSFLTFVFSQDKLKGMRRYAHFPYIWLPMKAILSSVAYILLKTLKGKAIALLNS